MMIVFWILAVANAVGFGTFLTGWWIVAPISLLAAAVAPRDGRPLLSIPLGAALGWAALLARSARAAGFETLTTAMASLLPLSPPVLMAITVALAASMALGAALLVGAFRRSPRS